jgi:hypothetical protein
MPPITRILQQFQDTADLPTLLDSARLAFDGMLEEIRARQDPASPMFATFTIAAAYAADGRDAVSFAPSLPWPPQPQPGSAEHEASQEDAGAEPVTGLLADLCLVLTSRLEAAAGSADSPGDREACRDAARCARDIHDLMAGTGR